MTEITGAQIIAKALRQNGADAIFDIPGDPIGSVLAAGRAEGMDTYSFRHEQAVSMAAQAYAFVSGKLGVGVVASGPAMTNAITGLTTAQANGWPMILIGGASEDAKRGLGDFQETPQVESAAPFTKWSIGMDNPRRIPWFVNTAIRKALSDRPGPVYLDFPSDVINSRVDEEDVEWLPPVGEIPRTYADPTGISRAVRLLEEAERPLLLLGEGAAVSGGHEEARELVDRLQIPFVPSPMGKGIVPDSHPLCFAGARSYALRNADVVVLAGARFNWMFHFGRAPRFAEDVKVIEIGPVAEEMGASVPPAVALVGDYRSVLRQLADEVPQTARLESPWVQALEEERGRNTDTVAPMVNNEDQFTNMYRLFREINAVVSPNAIVAADGESTMAVSRAMQASEHPAHRLDAGPTGCMGVGIPYAIGAQAAAPGNQVVCVTGDYAFGWNGMEIETACRYGMPILFVVANNGSVRPGDGVFNMKGYTGEDAVRYDLVMQAFGGHGEMVRSVDDLRPALERAAASGKTALVNVAVNPVGQRKPQTFGWLDRLGKMQYTAT